MYCTSEKVITTSKIKPSQFGLDNEDDLIFHVEEWIEQAESVIDDYCNRTFEEPVPPVISLACEEIVQNIIANRRVRQEGAYIKVNDWSVKTVPTSILTDDIKELLNPYTIKERIHRNNRLTLFAITGKKNRKKKKCCVWDYP